MRLNVDLHSASLPSLKAHSPLPKLRHYLQAVGPQASDYASPLPRVFLWGLKDPKVLSTQPQWIVRDGRITLLDWQKANSPPRWQKRLLVREELWDSILPAWRKCFCPYRLVSLPQALVRPADGLMIVSGGEEGAELPILTERLRCARLLHRAPRRVILLSRKKPKAALGSLLRKNFPDARPILVGWEQIEAVPSLDRLILVETSNFSLIGDPFMTHYLLSKGVRWSEEVKATVPLSLRHGLITECDV